MCSTFAKSSKGALNSVFNCENTDESSNYIKDILTYFSDTSLNIVYYSQCSTLWVIIVDKIIISWNMKVAAVNNWA